jgi:ribosomal protein S26
VVGVPSGTVEVRGEVAVKSVKCVKCGKKVPGEFALCQKCAGKIIESFKRFDEWCDQAGRPSDDDWNRRMTI